MNKEHNQKQWGEYRGDQKGQGAETFPKRRAVEHQGTNFGRLNLGDFAGGGKSVHDKIGGRADNRQR